MIFIHLVVDKGAVEAGRLGFRLETQFTSSEIIQGTDRLSSADSKNKVKTGSKERPQFALSVILSQLPNLFVPGQAMSLVH